MEQLQPTFFSTGNPQINFGFHLQSSSNDLASYLFKSWDNSAFQPGNSSANLTASDISTTRHALNEIPARSDDARLTVGESIATWGSGSRNQVRLSLDGFVIFDGWVDATSAMPSTDLSGTWTRQWP